MIEFRARRYHSKDNTPIVTDAEIQDYAEAVLADYKPELLRSPGTLNWESFLERYLGANLMYEYLYYDEDEGPIAGATAFNDERVRVFDRENRCIRTIEVPENTIIIDLDTMESGKEGFALFTGLHEGGHYLMHPCVYRRDTNQLTLFDFGLQDNKPHMVNCFRSALEGKSERPALNTQHDFREHQANTFSASIAMPRPTFIPVAQDLIRKAGYNDGIWIDERRSFSWDDFLEPTLSDVTNDLSSIFGVSKSAARVHLQRHGLLLSPEEYMQRRSQIAVSF